MGICRCKVDHRSLLFLFRAGRRGMWAGSSSPRSLRRFQPGQVPRVSLNPCAGQRSRYPDSWGYPWRPSGIIPVDHTIMLLMRNVLLISCLLAGVVTMGVYAQAPGAPARQKTAPAPTPAPAPAPTTQKPAGTTPAPRRAPATTSSRSGMAITVTSQQGATISGVHVALMG